VYSFPIPKFAIGKPSLCLNGSVKIPKFVLGSLRDKLELEGAIDYLSLTIAAWCRYINSHDEQGQPIFPLAKASILRRILLSE
jgi:mannitol 2-dehydrogenase